MAISGGVHRKVHIRKEKEARKYQEIQELEELAKRISEGITFKEPPSLFNELPISSRTLQGLERGQFTQMTEIQKCALPVALMGMDVVGMAKTGSGKTLAFLIPVLECLYRAAWAVEDGLGALILSPTRELAIQTFEVLRHIGKGHTLSAGLIIGGKDLRSEQDAIARMNILVATPGRLLQHMDQTAAFEWCNLQMLVLDEADRILDLGFAATLDAIIRQLPRQRQTLLFSATQPAGIEQLTRLSMHDPVHLAIDAQAAIATPDQLQQSYLLSQLDQKVDRLWEFIKGHLHAKTVVFLASCKQVRFVYESFCRLQPGVPLLCLHGRQRQAQRMAVFGDFCVRQSAVLFATDIAARGLDFPAVDWVLQVDCPEDVDTYIHRVGRTARFGKAGRALLFLLPSEAPHMIEQFKERRIPITHAGRKGKPEDGNDYRPAPPPKRTIGSKLQSLCSQDPEIKYLAQKALISYVRSVFIHPNKQAFCVEALPIVEFATSLGLPGAPKLRFVDRARKNASRQFATALAKSEREEEEDKEQEREEEKKKDDKGRQESQEIQKDHPLEKTSNNTLESDDIKACSSSSKKNASFSKIDRLFHRKNLNVLSEHYSKLRDNAGEEEEDGDELLQLKRQDHDLAPTDSMSRGPFGKVSHRDKLKTKKRYRLKAALAPSRLRFDEEGAAHEVFPFEPESTFDRDQAQALAERFVDEERTLFKTIDRQDAQHQTQLRRERRAEKKRKLGASQQEVGSSFKAARLAMADEDNVDD